jgi:hypothetical protein
LAFAFAFVLRFLRKDNKRISSLYGVVPLDSRGIGVLSVLDFVFFRQPRSGSLS